MRVKSRQKSEQLQIRVTRSQKATLKRLARRAGQDMSAYVLARVLPAAGARWHELLRNLRNDREPRFALAELNEMLAGLAPAELADAVADAEPLAGLSPYLQNYVAAMVEQAAYQKGIGPPAWVRQVEPVDEPHFGASLRRLRPHLLRAAAVPYKRRNIFVDAGVGDRV